MPIEPPLTAPPTILYIDADACPVKEEAYRVAARHGLKTYVVANAGIAVPRDPLIERVVVPAGPDAADDWIAGRAGAGAIVVTADIPLAARCVKAGAAVLAPNGKEFDHDAIGLALATRDLMDGLRSAGMPAGGPEPFAPRDRSAFLSALERAVRRQQKQAR